MTAFLISLSLLSAFGLVVGFGIAFRALDMLEGR
jgi:hypothetical protein